MLNELIETIGYDNILKTIKNSIDMSNSLYVKIPVDRELQVNDFMLMKKEIEVNQLEQSEWFKERELLSKYINSNKAIIQGTKNKYPKMVSSVHDKAIIFKWDNFLKHRNTTDDIEQSFKNLINEYLNILQVDDLYLKYYCNNVNKIINFLNGNNLIKINVKLFLDVDLKEYEESYSFYLKNNLFDDKTTCNIDGKKYGRLSQFYTINAKKPYLGHMTNATNEVHLIDEDNILKIFYLKQYMDIIKSEDICNGVGNIIYKMDFNSSTKKWFLDSYSNNPYKVSDDLPKDIYVKNVLMGKSKEKVIKHYSELTKYVLQLTDFKIKGFYGDNDRTENKFKTFSIMYYKYIERLNNTNFDNFKAVYNRLMSNLLKLYIYDEDIYKIKNIINFDICMRDYLFNTKIKEELKEMIDKIKEKILNYEKNGEKEYVIETDMEFFILCGQMVKYLKSKTQTSEKTNKLFYEYLMARKTKRLMDILQRDKARLDYSSSLNSRSNKIMYGLLKYYNDNKDNLKLINSNNFNMGLYYGDSILYVKGKQNNKSGNKEGEN